MKKVIALLTAVVTLTTVFATDIPFTWINNTEPDLAGYHLYYGLVSTNVPSPTNAISVITVATNSTTAKNLLPGYYWFAITPYTTNKVEGDLSSVILASVPRPVGGFKIP